MRAHLQVTFTNTNIEDKPNFIAYIDAWNILSSSAHRKIKCERD